MAIAIDDPKLREGVEVKGFKGLTDPNAEGPQGPNDWSLRQSAMFEGFIISGGINYADDTVTVKTAEGDTYTVPVNQIEFLDSTE